MALFFGSFVVLTLRHRINNILVMALNLCIIMCHSRRTICSIKIISNPTTTLLTVKFWITWYHFSAPLRKHFGMKNNKCEEVLFFNVSQLETNGHNSAIIRPIQNLQTLFCSVHDSDWNGI